MHTLPLTSNSNKIYKSEKNRQNFQTNMRTDSSPAKKTTTNEDNYQKIEEKKALILYKKTKIGKIDNLLAKEKFYHSDRSQYIELTQSALKKVTTNTIAQGLFLGECAFGMGIITGVSAIVTGGATLVLLCGAGSLGIGMYNTYKKGEIGYVKCDSPYLYDLTQALQKREKENLERMKLELQNERKKIYNEIKQLQDEILQLKNHN